MATKANQVPDRTDWPLVNGTARPRATRARLERKARQIATNTGQTYGAVLAHLIRENGQFLTIPEE